jgi:hypothetical protein
VFRRRRLATRVGDLNDALTLARKVYRHFGPSEAVAVVNCAGGVVDTYALDPITAGGPARLASIGQAIAGIRPACLVLILVSVRARGEAAVLQEADVDLWQGLHDRCADDGIRLADWFIIDGRSVRSMALSCASDSEWTRRPPDSEDET